jgi:hypothetical protein
MAEFKRVFSKAIMNKDMDERLVPNGQYRDANNIEISTSEASEVGTVQTLLGNTQRNTKVAGNLIDFFTTETFNNTTSTHDGPHNKSTVVGVIARADTDKIYYMVSAGGFSDAPGDITHMDGSRQVDYILEYDTVNALHRYVFVDIYQINHIVNGAVSNSTDIYVDQLAGNSDGLGNRAARIGMRLIASSADISSDDAIEVTAVAYDAGQAKWKITVSEAVSLDDDAQISFVADRVLNFNKGTIITGINIIDDFLFWTDNEHEPKKVNIPRSIAGTGGMVLLNDPATDVFNGDKDNFHTRLVTDKSFYDTTDRYEIVTNAAGDYPVFVDESHVTVIRKAPTQPLELEMFRTSAKRVNNNGDENPSFTETLNQSFLVDDVTVISPGSTMGADTNNNELILNSFETEVDFREGDIILFTRQDAAYSPDEFDRYDVRARVIESNVFGPNQLFLSGYRIEILSINEGLDADDLNWYVRIEDVDPLFQFKFPRFSYRYKYQDGEYSAFAPFSQVAFLPDYFEYHPKKGYNLGMVNQLRGLNLKYYHHDETTIPQDVVEIDLLYKEAGNPTVYTVKTLKRSDEDPIWPDLIQGEGNKRGSFEVATDMIHAVVPANQILRPYDNVPRKALAQEISANRLIYGNYLQNYTVLQDPIISVGIESTNITDLEDEYAYPSVKSMRKYQVGVVFSDEYGRETPVLTTKSASVTVSKEASNTRNRITAQLGVKGNSIPDWVKYYSFYVKETSVEYYTLAQDRWYNAADGNVWLSFPSSERNKVDIDTYLKLKKAHGSDKPVQDKTKYKILAIESEAPEFIKTEEVLRGIFVNGGGNLIGNSEEGFPLQDTIFFDVNKEAFDATFGDDFLLDTPDRMCVIFRSGDNSAKYDITNAKLLNDQNYRFHIQGKFGDEIAWITTEDTFATQVDDILFELIEKKVENRPEFDGRFFVKIYRDSALEQNVLGTDVDEDLFVEDSRRCRYLNNYGYSNQNPGGHPPLAPVYWGNLFGELDTTVNTAQHPTEYTHISNALGTYYWGGATLDQTNGVGGNGGPVVGGNLQASMMNFNPIYYLNASNAGVYFWRNFIGGTNGRQLFFDGATAFSLTGRMADNNSGDVPGNFYQPDNNYAPAGSINDMNVSAEDDGHVAQSFGNQNHAIGSMKQGKGIPSRGIWGSGRYMDISFHGIIGAGQPNTTGDVNSADSESVAMLNSQHDGELSEGITDFMLKLCTPGTKFRFNTDPDSVVYTVSGAVVNGPSFSDDNHYFGGVSNYTGAFGIRNFMGTGNNNNKRRAQFIGHNLRQRWTLVVEPNIGSVEGTAGYIPTMGTKNPNNGGPDYNDSEFRRALRHDYTEGLNIEILKPFYGNKSKYTENPAVWETEPKESVELDIYYQASGLIPVELNDETNEEYIPIGSTFKLQSSTTSATITHTVTGVNDQTITFTPAISALVTAPTASSVIKFTKRNHYSMEAFAAETAVAGATTLVLHGGPTTVAANQKLAHQKQYLDWNNCWCFGNGVESDRVRDSFNAPQMDNGVKASTVLAEQVREERRKHGMIFSGIYNSTSGVNDLNQFIAAEPITKDLNPVYGSIQKLVNRNTRLVMFCEDKVLRADTNKDLIFNADGNSQVVTSNKVIGAAVPYTGKYGVSTNPESVAVTPSNMYFTDVMRGKVLALGNQGDGIRVISDKGMKDYFSDLFNSYADECLGTYDARKKDYNLTVKKKYAHYQTAPHESVTISYSESSDGWESFKSFIPQAGVSLNNSYYTMFDGMFFEHHVNETRNNFYGTQYTSDITVLFNDNPTEVKSFTTINYEGSQANIPVFTDVDNNNYFTGDYSTNEGLLDTDNVTDGEYYNLTAKNGWYVDDMFTNLQTCGDIYFKNKEDKYFGFPSGETTALSNLDEREFTVQGIGLADITHSDNTKGNLVTLTFAVNASSTYVGSDGAGQVWDSTTISALETNKFTHTPQTIQVEGGAAIGSQTVYVPITAIIDGVFSGYALSADNLEIGNATLVSESARFYSVDGDVNADGFAAGPFLTFQFFNSDANGVRESSIGAATSIPGSPNNIVYVGLVLQGSFVAPTSDTIYYFDVDEKTTNIFEGNIRKACIRTDVDVNDTSVEAAPVVADVANITETTLLNTSHLVTKHSGNVNDSVSTEIARLTFTRAGNSYFASGSASPYVEYVNVGAYEGYYNETITPTFGTDANGLSIMTSFVVKIFYTPPTEGALAIDPDDFCKLGHRAIIHRQIRTPDTTGLGITSVDYDPKCASIGGQKIITVHGTPGSKYKIYVQKRTSTTSTTTATTGGYYNFETRSFQDDPAENLSSIGLKRRTTHDLVLPSVTVDTRYDIIIDVNVGGSTPATIGSNVPTNPGDAIITQVGVSTVTIKPITYTTPNFGTLTGLDIKAPKQYTYKTNKSNYTKESTHEITGGTSNVSSTRLKLQKRNSRLKTGMYIASLGNAGTIPHKTTITKIKDLEITLSNSCIIPDGTSLIAIPNKFYNKPFSITVPAGSGKKLYEKTGSVNNSIVKLGYSVAEPTKVNGAVTASTTINLDDTTGIEVGMNMISTNGTEVVDTTVTAVNNLTQITVNDAQTLTDNLEVEFDWAEDKSDDSDIISVKTSISDNKLLIEGYLNINYADADKQVSINIDNLVNVN